MKRLFTYGLMLLTMVTSAMALQLDKGKYYIISPRNNHNQFMKDTGTDVIQVNNVKDNNIYWRILPGETEGTYYIQNLNTLRYIQACPLVKEQTVKMGADPVSYYVVDCSAKEGTDVFGLTSTDHTNYAFTSADCIALNWQETNKNVQSYLAAQGTNHKSFWFIYEAEPPQCLLGAHDFKDGFCIVCGAGDPTYVTLSEDGFYEITNGTQLEWFSAVVNNGRNDASARLMNDIDMTGIEHTPIGMNVDLRWRGTFDGQGHRIKNLVIDRPDKTIQGLFGYLRGNSDSNTKVCNLIIDKSCSFRAQHQVGAIAGCSQGNLGTITLENIVNEADVTAEGGTDAAALVGGSTGNAPTWIIRNIINTGSIGSTAADGYAGMVAGYYGNTGTNIQENIINLGKIYGFNGTNQLGRLTGSFTNVFDLSETEGAGQFVEHEFTAEDVTSGKLCYYLNGDQTKILFTQTLGTDAYPMPFTTSKQVYMHGQMLCDGTPVGDNNTYSNENNGSELPPHSYEDGSFFCSVCGRLNEDYIKPVDGVYHMSTPEQLTWLAAYVAAGHANLEVVLDNDVDMDGVDFPGIGSLALPFLGHFDGQYHTISNLVMADVVHEWSGFFNFIQGGSTIENLRLDETCYLSGAKGTALIGGSGKAGNILLRNLAFEGTVEGSAACAGAILGANFQSVAKLTVENCYSTGTISGALESAALIAWLGNNGAVIRNCWTSATAAGIQEEAKYAFRHDNATVTNCYSLYGTQANRFTDEDIESGALCYKLNGDQTNITWFQNLDNGKDVDAIPTFMPGHGTVMVKAEMHCDGTYDSESATYSNSAESVIPPHTYKDGFCEVCGHEDETYPFIRVFANADHNAGGGYTNKQSADGSGLAINNSVAEHWNQKFFDSYQTITGLEKGIYKLRVQGLQRASHWNDTNWDSYEDGELDPEVAVLHHNSQYYVENGGKRMSNLFVDIADFKQEEKISTALETYHAGAGCWVPNSLAACKVYFAKQLYWNEPLYFAVSGEQDTLKVGVENHMWLAGNWTVWDTWRLEKVAVDDAAAVELIRAQQEKNLQDLETLSAMDSLATTYNEAKAEIMDATTLDEIINISDKLSRLPEQIRLSHLAYIDFENAVAAVRADVENRETLYGEYAELLYTYLNTDQEEVEGLPHGTYQSIMDNKPLTDSELTAEITFLQDLLLLAIKNSITAGSDISNLIVNADFTADGAFKGWSKTIIRQASADYNLDSNMGFLDIYPVCRCKNTAFDIHQDLEEGLPNGIYELIVPGYYRTGNRGGGDLEGNDLVSANLYINDFHSPLENIYKFTLPYDDAVNGVNCRYDSANDPEAPHNGEQVSSQDVDTGFGYVPEGPWSMSFGFAAGRFINHAYAIVEDGKLRIGIQNTGTPWYLGGFTGWGKFQLIYRGQSEEALQGMMENFQKHFENLQRAQELQMFYISMDHLKTIESLIAQVDKTSDIQDKFELIKKLNAEFNTIDESYNAYQQLNTMATYLSDLAGTSEDEELANNCYEVSDQILNHLGDGDLSDPEAKQYLIDIKDNTSIGGGFYIQGDLVDPEGVEMAYNVKSKVYPLTRQDDGTYTGEFTAQDRTNLVHTNARAGFYFTRLNETYKSNQAYRRFVTPGQNVQRLVAGAGSDYQACGGKFRVTLNPADSTVVFDVLDYKWHDRVFVCGSVMDKEGNEHRYLNDEYWPLQHQGNGIYTGTVTFFQDYVYPGYATFLIMASRSTLDEEENSIVTRPGWLEASYAGTTNDTYLVLGEKTEDLVRGWGNAHRMRIEWTSTEKTQDYDITFDMSARTIIVNKKGGNDDDAIQGIEVTPAAVDGIYDLSGRRIQQRNAQRGIYITNGKKVVY